MAEVSQVVNFDFEFDVWWQKKLFQTLGAPDMSAPVYFLKHLLNGVATVIPVARLGSRPQLQTFPNMPFPMFFGNFLKHLVNGVATVIPFAPLGS